MRACVLFKLDFPFDEGYRGGHVTAVDSCVVVFSCIRQIFGPGFSEVSDPDQSLV